VAASGVKSGPPVAPGIDVNVVGCVTPPADEDGAAVLLARISAETPDVSFGEASVVVCPDSIDSIAIFWKLCSPRLATSTPRRAKSSLRSRTEESFSCPVATGAVEADDALFMVVASRSARARAIASSSSASMFISSPRQSR
jgi:hypothetical protein